MMKANMQPAVAKAPKKRIKVVFHTMLSIISLRAKQIVEPSRRESYQRLAAVGRVSDTT